MRMKRFALTLAVLLLSTASPRAASPDLAPLQQTLERIVKSIRANVGISVRHVESGAQVSVHGDQRFPMASVYKLPIAVELLTQASERRISLDKQIAIGASDIRPCCTLSRHHPNGGTTLTLLELLDLMMVESDNTASDVVLKTIGGPPAVQARLNALGFTGIDVTRYEGDINLEMTGVAAPPPQDEWTLELQRQLVLQVDPAAMRDARARYLADPRDTATPDEMANFLARLQKGELLPPMYTTVLLNLMSRAKTGPSRLKGPLPPDTIVAHKTGTMEEVINDVGIVTLPDDSAIPGHIAIAVFVTSGGLATMQRAISQLSAASFEFFTGRPLPKPVAVPAKKPAKSAQRRGARHRR
jgi:beta-lactamase class A